jgi:hypothetical protein
MPELSLDQVANFFFLNYTIKYKQSKKKCILYYI